MNKFLTVFLLCLSPLALADGPFLVPNGATSQIIGPICVPDVAGVEVETTLDFDTTSLVIYAETNVGTHFSYVEGDSEIINVTASGTWEDPSADEIGLDVLPSGCVALHVRDEVLGVMDATVVTFAFKDGGTLIMDHTVTVIQNVSTNDTLATDLDLFDPTTDNVIVMEMTASALADFFDVDSGVQSGSAVSGSVIAEAADAMFSELEDTTIAELTSVPAVNASLADMIKWGFMLDRNELNQTTSTQTLMNDAGNSEVAEAEVSDDGITFTRGEWLSD